MLTLAEAKKAVLKAGGTSTEDIEKWTKANCSHLSDREQYLVICAGKNMDEETDLDKAQMIDDAVKKDKAIKEAEDKAEKELLAYEEKRKAKGLAVNRVSQ